MSSVAEFATRLAPGNLERLRADFDSFVPSPIDVPAAYELMLQSYLFFGYAQAIEAAKVFTKSVRERGLKLPEFVDGDEPGEWRERGEILCAKIYRPNYHQLVSNMAQVSPELANWMVVEGYGKVLSRPGPSPLEREVASITFLTISGHPVQLYSHIRGAKNLGAEKSAILGLMTTALLTREQAELLRATIEQVYAK